MRFSILQEACSASIYICGVFTFEYHLTWEEEGGREVEVGVKCGGNLVSVSRNDDPMAHLLRAVYDGIVAYVR